MSYRDSPFAGAEIDFSQLESLGTIPERLRQRGLRDAMAKGLPVDPKTGETDWNKAASIVGGYDAKAGLDLLRSTQGGYGSSNNTVGLQPIWSKDGTGRWHAHVINKDGSGTTELKSPDGQGWARPQRLFLNQWGDQQTIPASDVGGYDESSQPDDGTGTPINEEGDSWSEPPQTTREQDPQVPEPAPIPAPPQFDPYRMGPPDQPYDAGQPVPGDPQQMAQNYPAPSQPRVLQRGDPRALQQQKTEGELAGKDVYNYPSFEKNTEQMIGTLNDIQTDPNLQSVLGMVEGKLIPRMMQTPSQAGVQSKIDRFQGQAFLAAYNSLKGAGAISEAEGAKAALSIARLSEQGMSDEDYMQAIQEAKKDVFDLLNVARRKTGMPEYVNPFAKAKSSSGPIDIREFLKMRQ